ncbi:MAG: 30S ribosomal protein S6 [Chthoniobacterales bacterium]
MSKRYEALIAINIQGKEDSHKDVIERLEKEFKSAGATLEQTQRLEKRDFAYEHNHVKSAYYVNFIFQAEPSVVEALRAKFKLDSEVALQQYTRLADQAPAAA